MSARAGIEPIVRFLEACAGAISSETAKTADAQLRAHNLAELRDVAMAWPKLLPELRAVVLPAATWESFHELLEAHRVLQFTATPFRNDGRRIPGRIIYNFPLRLAQEQGYFQQMDFLEVVELDDQEADRKIAEAAVARLRRDRQAGFDHLLLARADIQQRAEALLANIYAPLYADLNPIVIHSGISQRREKLDDIRARKHLIIICVDMFGEGYDLPQLKIAALHDVHKSLAITLV